MNFVVDNFDQILDFAKGYGLILSKKRAILREYLQTKILDAFYQEKAAVDYCFVGGTSLRLLHGLDRFSEDLDFDQIGGTSEKTGLLMERVYKRLTQENLEIDMYKNETEQRKYYEFRFKGLLRELNISNNEDEKLMIKFDFEMFWKGQKREVFLLNRYGFLVNVVSIPLGQMLVQKLHAYLNRGETQPRDIYDIVWLLGREVRIDKDYAEVNGLPADLASLAVKKFEGEAKKLITFKSKIRPFLINENYEDKLDLFARLLKEDGLRMG